ncbi:MAG: hypothetical protein JXR95_00795 [Deltaproteobacteria bacterium]|nr:hypothetical protein [Deltaproteobacteria bacterium]
MKTESHEKGENFLLIEEKIQFGFPKKLKLYFSFNRYAYLLLISGILLPLSSLILKPAWWWLTLLLLFPAIWMIKWAYFIHSQTSKKFHILKKQMFEHSESGGELSPLSKYCGDPCYRVVADEILIQRNVGFFERRKIIRKNTRIARSENNFSFAVDFKNHVVYRSDGQTTEKFKFNEEQGELDDTPVIPQNSGSN